jgi:sialic acid synthase SpsE/sugar phosphate isomerase/epimerase
MIIDRNLSGKIVSKHASIKDSLKVIDKNHQGYVFIVDEYGYLEGILTDGDYRRWSLTQSSIDLQRPVFEICKKDYKSALFTSERSDIRKALSSENRFIPLVDSQNRVVAVAELRQPVVRLADKILFEKSPTFVIAEIGLNHNGSIERALEMIDLAAKAGVDSVKFQMRNMSDLYLNGGDSNDIREDLGSQYVLDLLTKFQLTNQEMLRAFDYCKTVGVIPICTPWDSSSLKVLENYGMEVYKVASADFTNHDFLIELAATGKTLICSTGMCSEFEIIQSVELLNKHAAVYILLQCNSTYPTPYKDVNLKYLLRLKEIGDCFVGYSGHERGNHIPLAAVSIGAKVIEKHFTLDKSMEGNDHKVSLLPHELEGMVRSIRDIELAMGTATPRTASQGELMNRNTLAKSLIAAKEISKGDILTEDMFLVKAPGKGLQSNRKKELLGTKAKRDFELGNFFYESDLPGSDQGESKRYQFKRPFGVPVRFHDFKTLLNDTNADFVEFHLSYKDLDYDIESGFSECYDMDLVVHSPDTFQGDFLLDLSNLDEGHRIRSISELQRTVDCARKLKRFFKKAHRPLIVVSLGGYSTHAPISDAEKSQRYELMSRSLSALDTDGVEVIGQTLPPYPWYFGGQLYLNLFVLADDTVDFCKRNSLRLCFDISHSMLTCNEFGLSFNEYVEKVGPYTAHLHIADAKGVDGEGLQIGEGQIDFSHLSTQLGEFCPTASFIPEIWQGHKDNGAGFWTALARLEKFF